MFLQSQPLDLVLDDLTHTALVYVYTGFKCFLGFHFVFCHSQQAHLLSVWNKSLGHIVFALQAFICPAISEGLW